jgi:hypothetical protein
MEGLTMKWSVRSLLIWIAALAVLFVVTRRLPALGIFLFAIAIPVALLLHVPVPRTTSRRILFASCVAVSCLPLYFAAMGPLYFLYAAYELRPEREAEWLVRIETTIFGPANWVYEKCPFSVYEFVAQRYYGEWMMYGHWYFETTKNIPWMNTVGR